VQSVGKVGVTYWSSHRALDSGEVDGGFGAGNTLAIRSRSADTMGTPAGVLGTDGVPT
jgi:hypothetical protein